MQNNWNNTLFDKKLALYINNKIEWNRNKKKGESRGKEKNAANGLTH